MMDMRHHRHHDLSILYSTHFMFIDKDEIMGTQLTNSKYLDTTIFNHYIKFYSFLSTFLVVLRLAALQWLPYDVWDWGGGGWTESKVSSISCSASSFLNYAVAFCIFHFSND